jgi:hypothetical protein
VFTENLFKVHFSTLREEGKVLSAISIYSNFCISKKVQSKKTAVFRSLYHFYKENKVLSRVLPMNLVAKLLYTTLFMVLEC